MIQVEYLNEGTLIRHYSDSGLLLLQTETGIKYPEAVDVVPCRYTYVETEEPVTEPEDIHILGFGHIEFVESEGDTESIGTEENEEVL